MIFINDKQKTNNLFLLTKKQFLELYPYITEKEYIDILDTIWQQFSDIPVNENGTIIEEDFYCWGKGSEKEEIWHWFDSRVNEGIGKRYFN